MASVFAQMVFTLNQLILMIVQHPVFLEIALFVMPVIKVVIHVQQEMIINVKLLIIIII